MRIAYSNLACPEWSMEAVMRYGALYGYDGVELRLYDGEVFPCDLDVSDRQKITRLAQDYGLDIVCLGASTRFAMEDTAARQQNVQELIAYVELAAKMGVPMVRTFGGVAGLPNRQAPEYLARCVERVAESLCQVAPRAEELGVEVLLETHDEFSSSALVRDVLQCVESEYVGAIWDIHHPVRMHETVEETYANLADRLRHVHLKDAARNGDDWQLVVFGEGDVPVADIVRKLLQTGYNRYVTVEWEKKWHPEIAAAAIALPQHIEILRGYLRDATL
ncbi:sugar phosphate isomerase/epimerase family protein [Alicyclobacillus suci]|uniref:sugar phosphate isomerase/epimerase family protein n=1 Tax=Alicyclobacillus suci TaxID=2816080 RepID=UPI0016622A6B|nr:sugar phosphate isomerase/epimerase family protein [Alicyclobacillus suci]